MVALNSKRVWQGVAAFVDFPAKLFWGFCSNGACKGLKALNAPSPGEASIPFFQWLMPYFQLKIRMLSSPLGDSLVTTRARPPLVAMFLETGPATNRDRSKNIFDRKNALYLLIKIIDESKINNRIL